jgi:hypothetical protein
MAPLLYRHKGAILFIHTIIDFILLAKYKSHNKDIIEYFKAVLYQMDKTKEVFLLYWLNDKNLPNFNIPKLHAISHYPEIIHVFSILIKTTIEYSERAYIL